MMKSTMAVAAGVLMLAGVASAQLRGEKAMAPADAGHRDSGVAKPDVNAMTSKAIAYLKSQQDQASGGWSVNPSGPSFPAITGLVVTGMLMEPGVKDTDEAVAGGVRFMMSKVQSDGGIYDKVLPSYNTAICLCALSKVKTPEVTAVVHNAAEFLKSLQFGEGAVARPALGDESAKPVDKDHAYYGGWGYGHSGRPDLSNTAWALDGLHASGVPSDDPAFQRAMVFLQRTQMVEKAGGMDINAMEYAKGSRQGGFIYSTSESKDAVGSGQSQSSAKTIEETMDDGTKVSRLRAYGSMTYSGFKSYLYAGLSRNDPRVQAAMDWIAHNYALTENPGAGGDGLYYYYVVFARAMAANGEPTIRTVSADGETAQRRWAEDLVAQLATLQNEDGSFRPMKDGARWMEDNKVLITAYALIALEEARGQMERK